jgi:hypothetical protein
MSQPLETFKLIQLNKKNNSNSQPNVLELQLPIPFDSQDNEVALASAILYYSWFNIQAKYGNNTLSYVFNGTQVDITFPDGFYSISDISGYINYIQDQNGHYTLDSAGDKVYYINFQTDVVYYAFTLTLSPIVLPVGGSNPHNVTLSGQTPQLILNNLQFNKLIGFNAGTYPPTGPSNQIYQEDSQFIAEISRVNAINIGCNLINNSFFSNNPSIIHTFSPSVPFAEQIVEEPKNLIFHTIPNGNYYSIKVTFMDELYNPLDIIDTNIIVTLYVRNRKGRLIGR